MWYLSKAECTQKKHTVDADVDAFVVREWCCMKAGSLIWHHDTHFEAQRTSSLIVEADWLCDAVEIGVQVLVKEEGFSVGFVFLR